MIKTLEMYGVECDNCHELFIDDYTGFCAWNDGGLAHEEADDSGWYSDGNGNHYCPKCHTVDDEDNLKIDTSRTKTI